MTSFFVLATLQGDLVEIKWCEPSHLLSTHTRSLSELFGMNEWLRLDDMVRGVMLGRRDPQLWETFRLPDGQQLELVCLPLDERVALFGMESRQEEQDDQREVLRNMAWRFMSMLKNYLRGAGSVRSEDIRRQFEQIQGLNNELINTRRQLEKANARLNTLNADLNNRLVRDELTGLVSRYQYRTEMDMLLGQNPGKMGVFVFIDIDNFKQINDTHGHGLGDRYLAAFADRLRQLDGPQRVCMRIAGDEFGLFVYGWEQAGPGELNGLWSQIRETVLNGPVVLDGAPYPLSFSAGMAVLGRDTDEIYQLIDYADFAMYQAKASGKNQMAVFDQQVYRRSHQEGASDTLLSGGQTDEH